MKKIALLAFVLIGQIAFAQKKNETTLVSVPYNNGQVVYEKSFSAPGISVEQLYSNANLWFVERYKSTEGIQFKDRLTGRVVGEGVEFLTFKGPLKMDVASKVKMTIQIDGKPDSYNVRIFNIVYGYQSDPKEERVFFSAEDLFRYISGEKVRTPEGINPIPFNKKQSTRALESLNGLIDNIMASIEQTMSKK